jgi:hypothetical protein
MVTAAVLPSGPLSLLAQQHAAFLTILPRIELHAAISFRHIQCTQTREERIAECRALAWKWFQVLALKGRDATRFPTALASYAARAVRSGRRLVGQEKGQDVLSPLAQQRHGFHVESLPHCTARAHEDLFGQVHGQRLQDAYEERLRDNTRTPPDEQAAFRIDFPNWLQTRTERDRQIIAAMARNERTKDISRQFGLSEGRVSQLRRQYQEDWELFGALPEEDVEPHHVPRPFGQA